ncbi:MAG: hypothetical protein LUC95_00785, partial [Lachnospiraceae bacterium]|nr:hypothetical protein [Lachnospiraceae bacterium]
TDANGNSVTTDTVTLSIQELQESTITIITQPQSIVVANEGDPATVSVVAEGDDLSYNWYYKNPGNSTFTDAKTYTASTTIRVTAARNGREMYCVITDANGNSVTTDTITLSIQESQETTVVSVSESESVSAESVEEKPLLPMEGIEAESASETVTDESVADDTALEMNSEEDGTSLEVDASEVEEASIIETENGDFGGDMSADVDS